MDWLLDLRPIRFFGLYLAVIFILGTALRIRQYWTIVSLVFRLRGRWPNLTRLLLSHRHLFLTWATVRPLVVVLVLLVGNMLASQLVWPEAQAFQVRDLVIIWPAIPVIVLTAAAMIAFDVFGTVRVSKLDRAEVEKYFDQAEHWLVTWKAPVIRILSLGFINPRKIVAHEVRTALEKGCEVLNSSLWWVSTQTVLRLAFGLSLWGSWALQGWLRASLGVES